MTRSASNLSEAARRYAAALFELGEARGAADLAALDAAFQELAGAVRGHDGLTRLVESPAFDREEKADALAAVARRMGLPELLVKFVGTLAKNGRAADLLDAQTAFSRLYDDHRGVVRAVARTARPLTDVQRARLQRILSSAAGGSAELTEEVDPALIGGVQLQIGSRLVDASTASKLNAMHAAMKGA